jgi:OFA family oxalate/formate antiporter-like MFS transporter
MRRFFHPRFPIKPAAFPFFYGWIILIVSSIGVIASIPGQTMGFSVFTQILSEELGLTASVLSTCYLIGTVGSGLLLPRVGRLFDRIGARVMGVGVSILMGLGLFYLSQIDVGLAAFSKLLPTVPSSTIAFVLITIGFFWLRFTGQGALTMASRSMLGKWFNRHRGMVMSLSGVAVSFSFSLAPWALNELNEAFTWKGTWFLLGCIIMFGMGLVCWVFFRDNPEECGLVMDGSIIEDDSKPKNQDLVIYREFTRSEALKTTSFWIFNLALGMQSFLITGYTFHVVAIADGMGIELQRLLSAFIPASITGIVLSLIAGVVNPYIRLKYILALMPLGGFIFASSFFLEGTTAYLLLIVGLGFSGGTFGIVSGIVWPRFFGRKHLGSISGVNAATMVYASAIAPLVYSLFNDISGSFLGVLFGSAIVCLLLVAASFFADNPQRKLGLS